LPNIWGGIYLGSSTVSKETIIEIGNDLVAIYLANPDPNSIGMEYSNEIARLVLELELTVINIVQIIINGFNQQLQTLDIEIDLVKESVRGAVMGFLMFNPDPDEAKILMGTERILTELGASDAQK
jgi:hypothetical protein